MLLFKKRRARELAREALVVYSCTEKSHYGSVIIYEDRLTIDCDDDGTIWVFENGLNVLCVMQGMFSSDPTRVLKYYPGSWEQIIEEIYAEVTL